MLQKKDKILILLVYTLLTFFYTTNFYGINTINDLPQITKAYSLTNLDLDITRYTTSYTAHKLLTDPRNILHMNIYYPYRYTLLLGDSYATPALLMIPPYILTNNLILSYNLVWYFLMLLSAYGAFLLAFYYMKNKYAAFLAGILFGFFTYKLQFSFLIHTLTIAFLPLIILYYHKLIDNPSTKNMLLFTLYSILLALSGWYIALFGLFTFLILFLFSLIIEKNKITLRFFKKIFFSFIILLVILLPLFFSYKIHAQSLYAQPNLNDAMISGIPLENYFRPLAQRTIYHALFPGIEIPKSDRGHAFLGYTLLIFIVCGFLFFPSTRKTPYFATYLTITLIAILFSLGPLIRITNQDAYKDQQPSFFTNHLLLSLPLLSNFRGFERYALVVGLGLSILSAFFLTSILKNKKTLFSLSLTVLLSLFFLTETYLIKDNYFQLTEKEIPPVYQWLKDQPNNIVLFELPDIEHLHAFYSTYHWKNHISGLSSAIPNGYIERMGILNTFPSEESLYHLRNLNVTYIIIHHDLYKDAYFTSELPINETTLLDRVQHESRLSLITRIGNASVYQIKENAIMRPSLFTYYDQNWWQTVPEPPLSDLRAMSNNSIIKIISPDQRTTNFTLTLAPSFTADTLTILLNGKLIGMPALTTLTTITFQNIALQQGENDLLFSAPTSCRIPYYETKLFNFDCQTFLVSLPTFINNSRES